MVLQRNDRGGSGGNMSPRSVETILDQHPDKLYMDALRVAALGTLVSLGGLVLHVVTAVIVLTVDAIHVPYPWLVFGRDVFLNLFLALAAVFLCMFNIILVGLAVIGDTPPRTVIRLVVVCAIAIGFGLAVFRFSFSVLVESFPLWLAITTCIAAFA